MKKYTTPKIKTIEMECARMLADSETGRISKDGEKASLSADGKYETAADTWDEAY